MAEIAVVGCGQAGLVVATSFASLGHSVVGIDIDRRRIEACRRGAPPIDEPGLEDLLRRGLKQGRLTFLDEYPDVIGADFVFIAVDTPTAPSGAANLHSIRSAAASMAPRLREGAVVVNKSTVPVGTCDEIAWILHRGGARGVSVVSNPEFL